MGPLGPSPGRSEVGLSSVRHEAEVSSRSPGPARTSTSGLADGQANWPMQNHWWRGRGWAAWQKPDPVPVPFRSSCPWWRPWTHLEPLPKPTECPRLSSLLLCLLKLQVSRNWSSRLQLHYSIQHPRKTRRHERPGSALPEAFPFVRPTGRPGPREGVSRHSCTDLCPRRWASPASRSGLCP